MSKPTGTCAVYIMANARNTVLYTGVTSDLRVRLEEHRQGKHSEAFTRRYNIGKLVYYETTPNIAAAIAREKQIKAGSRARKIALIEGLNPEWRDLAEDW
jgi:putative endonuclease